MFFSFLDFLNPLAHTTASHYSSAFYNLILSIFSGTGAKILSVSSFFLAFWSLVRRENVQAFVSFLFISLILAYTGGILGHIF